MIFLKKVSIFKLNAKVYLIPVYTLKNFFVIFLQTIIVVYLANLYSACASLYMIFLRMKYIDMSIYEFLVFFFSEIILLIPT